MPAADSSIQTGKGQAHPTSLQCAFSSSAAFKRLARIPRHTACWERSPRCPLQASSDYTYGTTGHQGSTSLSERPGGSELRPSQDLRSWTTMSTFEAQDSLCPVAKPARQGKVLDLSRGLQAVCSACYLAVRIRHTAHISLKGIHSHIVCRPKSNTPNVPVLFAASRSRPFRPISTPVLLDALLEKGWR